jgi:hypothetical protein
MEASQQHSLTISDLRAGIYLLKISIAETVFIKRLVILP